LEVVGENIDRAITVELRQNFARGLTSKIYAAARKKAGKPLTYLAGQALTKAVKRNDLVIVSTGWVVPNMPDIGEIDGPPGAASLARMVQYGLEGRTLFLTEKSIIPAFEAACSAAAVRLYDLDKVKEKVPLSVASSTFPIDENEAKSAAKKVIEVYQPAAIITLEKCGRNEKGIWHTGLGNDMSPTTAKIDYLVEAAREKNILTIGIGDVGNEIGMGNIHDETIQALLDSDVPWAENCRCGCGGSIVTVTETDHLIAATQTNKGAYGLVAMVSALIDRPFILQDMEMQHRMVEKCAVDLGVWDSITVTNSLTEDGVPVKYSMYLVDILRGIVEARKQKEPLFENLRRETGW